MTSPVPRWVIALLLAVLAVVFAVGIAVESSVWAMRHPFTLNLLSSLGGFAASGVFASVVINRLARRRYWPAELDARSATARDADVLLRDILWLFGQTIATGSPSAILRRVLEQLESGDLGDVPFQRDAFRGVEKRLADLENIETRFSFLDDPDLIYRASRLRRKGKTFLQVWDDMQDPNAAGDPTQIALGEAAIALLEAISDLQYWVHSAPDRKMRGAVTNRAFRSDLDE